MVSHHGIRRGGAGGQARRLGEGHPQVHGGPEGRDWRQLRNWGEGGIRHGRALYAIIAFMAGIVAGTGYLTLLAVLPGEAFTFLVGTILMYLFGLLGPRFQVA